MSPVPAAPGNTSPPRREAGFASRRDALRNVVLSAGIRPVRRVLRRLCQTVANPV